MTSWIVNIAKLLTIFFTRTNVHMVLTPAHTDDEHIIWIPPLKSQTGTTKNFHIHKMSGIVLKIWLINSLIEWKFYDQVSNWFNCNWSMHQLEINNIRNRVFLNWTNVIFDDVIFLSNVLRRLLVTMQKVSAKDIFIDDPVPSL